MSYNLIMRIFMKRISTYCIYITQYSCTNSGILYTLYVNDTVTRLILGLQPANDKRRYNVTPSLIDWTKN